VAHALSGFDVPFTFNVGITANPQATPEPSSFVLAAFLGLGLVVMRRKYAKLQSQAVPG
jgi:hypothetical protein